MTPQMNEKLMYGTGESAQAMRKKLPVPESAAQLLIERGTKGQDVTKSEKKPSRPASCSKGIIPFFNSNTLAPA